MCLLCLDGVNSRGDVARRLYVLDLLALIEQPGTFPDDAALRLSREIMAILDAPSGRLRCDLVISGETTGGGP